VDSARQDAPSEPPPLSVEAFFPARAFGYATIAYRAFVEALTDGLAEYLTRPLQGGGLHGDAAPPLPAA
jgi:hypothetical protein